MNIQEAIKVVGTLFTSVSKAFHRTLSPKLYQVKKAHILREIPFTMLSNAIKECKKIRECICPLTTALLENTTGRQ